MIAFSSHFLLAFVWPIKLEFFSGWTALGLFAALALPIVWLGVRCLANLGRLRQWVAIGLRLAVLGLIVLILGGIRLQREPKDVEVVIVRDISGSTQNVSNYPGASLQASLDNYVANVANANKPPMDRVGQVSFQENAFIDSPPETSLYMDTHAIRDPGNGTDAAAGLQLALAMLHPDAMHRLLLIWDGNSTHGDLDSAIALAASNHIPIDVMPLHYSVDHEVLVDKIVAPQWRRENEASGIDVYLKSTNTFPVTGKLTVLHQGLPMDLDPVTPGVQSSIAVKLLPAPDVMHPSITPVHVNVPPLQSPGVHEFHCFFVADKDQPNAPGTAVASRTPSAGPSAASAAVNHSVDTLTSNNDADTFTFVRGKGHILYVDNVENGQGEILRKALADDSIEITPENHITPAQFPTDLLSLESYDAIILANVPYGPGGLSEEQQKNLAYYVHDMGGGLVMIGGPDTFGAGGWEGRALESVLPVNMDIPAQRQIPKGALVLAMDPAEVPEGNYWGQQCAIEAMKTLSAKDDVGIITYGWNGNGGACNWDYPLSEKGDGSKFISATKHWGLGDLPSFEDAINLALDGDGVSPGLIASDARQKHIIVITDDDPQMPSDKTIQRCIDAHVTVSTITVYPHMPHNIAPGTRELAKKTGGRSFGPIEDHPDKLPQIFVKEATIVRRSLIQESKTGIPLALTATNSDMVKGLDHLPPVTGMVLTSRKNNPQVEIPIVAGNLNDPLLAHWQAGLGRSAVYTSDATTLWGSSWVGSQNFNKLWSQVIRGVIRPPMSTLFDVSTTQSGDKGHIVVESIDKENNFQNFLNITGKIVGPDSRKPATDIRLVQTAPGRYEADFNASDPGTYVAALGYTGPKGAQGMLLGGVSVNGSAEMRDLQSNDAELKRIADQTGGRIVSPFDPAAADLFDRAGLTPTIVPLPVWNLLMPFLIAMILIDVATRRIAWDWVALKRYAGSVATSIREFTATRRIDTRISLDALQKVREKSATRESTPLGPAISDPLLSVPNPQAKFQAPKGVDGDITTVVGGAKATPIPKSSEPSPSKSSPRGGGMSNLLEAKRRAQRMIEESQKNLGE